MALLQPSPLPNCRDLTELFFDDDESLSTIYDCRSVCFSCPFFEGCERYATESFPQVSSGVFAGLPASTRRAIYEGTYEFVDWRDTWDPSKNVVEGLAPVEVREPCLWHPRFKTHQDGTRACAVCGTRVRLIPRQ